MPHTCSECGESFSTLTKLRLHDCDGELQLYTVQIQVKLITNESQEYTQSKRVASNLNTDQPVFPKFDLAVESGKPVPPQSIQQQVSTELDEILRERFGLWDWANTVSKEQVRQTAPQGQESTTYVPIGSIEVTDDGSIEDTFITLDEIKGRIVD